MAGTFPQRLFSSRLLASFAAACTLGAGACDVLDAPAPEPASADISVGHQPMPSQSGLPCTQVTNLRDMRVYYPEILRGQETLARLPLTGAPVNARVSAGEFDVCTMPSGGQALGMYSPGSATLRFTVAASHNIVAHEYFHAYQNLNGADAFRQRALLTGRDAGFVDMMSEATTVAFELVVRKEAELRGVGYDAGAATAASGPTLRNFFDSFYNRAFLSARNGGAAGAAAENYALEHAGRMAVIYLMSGYNEHWAGFYSQQAIANVNGLTVLAEGCTAAYRQQRDTLYRAAGHVSDTMNLTPLEFIGDTADVHIANYFGNFLKTNDDADMQNRCTSSKGPAVS